MTPALDLPRSAVAWLGRQGTRAVAALGFIGIAVPPLGALLKPYVADAVPDVFLGIMLQAVAPMMAAPALASLIGATWA